MRQLGFVLLLAGAPLAAELTEELEVRELFASLPTPLVVESTEDGDAGRVIRLRSAEPVDRGAAGAVYLRATLTVTDFPDAVTAEEEIERRLVAADPDTGLSYAWDYLAVAGNSIVHLHAACTFSEESFQAVVRGLAERVAGEAAGAGPSFWCRCGGGCRAGSPIAAGGGAERRLPPVRRVADPEELEPDDDEYDNRLDPSGSWKSAIGELALMHDADTLSFAYLAVFGPTAHICEGAGVAGLVATDRYEHVDEQGTVAFVITDTEVRMETVEGIASFCGAGWPGERFSIDRFESPIECVVTVEHAHFHVADRVEPERRPTSVMRGDRVEAVPAWEEGGEAWLLARFSGPLATRAGLLAGRDLDCPSPER